MGHIQMSVYLHSGPNTGMADRLGKSGKVKIRIVLVVEIVVGHIGMPQAMDIDGMGEADGLADFSVGLQGAGMDGAAKGKCGRAADIFMLPLDGGIFLFDPQLGGLLLRAGETQFRLPQFLRFALLDQGRLLVKLLFQHFKIMDGLPV